MRKLVFFYKNQTWELITLPSRKQKNSRLSLGIHCQVPPWWFVERHKAWLIAKWYTWTYEVDFLETFSPMARLNLVRILLSVVLGLCINLISRMPIFMENFGRKYTWINSLDMLFLVVSIFFVDYEVRCMVWSNLLMHGLIDLVPLYLDMVSSDLFLIIMSLFVTLPLALLFWLFMWMTLLSLELNPLVSLTWRCWLILPLHWEVTILWIVLALLLFL